MHGEGGKSLAAVGVGSSSERWLLSQVRVATARSGCAGIRVTKPSRRLVVAVARTTAQCLLCLILPDPCFEPGLPRCGSS